jgi:hypothetical protein
LIFLVSTTKWLAFGHAFFGGCEFTQLTGDYLNAAISTRARSFAASVCAAASRSAMGQMGDNSPQMQSG